MKKELLIAVCFSIGMMLAFPVCAEEKGVDKSTEVADPVSAISESMVINNEGEAEQLTIEDLIKIHSDNQLRWDKYYEGAKVFATSEVKEIKTEEWLVLETESYTPHIVLHLGNGWLVSGADSDFVETLNIGDKVQFSGTITGYMKYSDAVAVLYTKGCATCVQKPDASTENAIKTMIHTYLDDRNYSDAEAWFDFYSTNSSDDEEGIAELQSSIDEALGNCYQGTYLDKYDSMFTCTDVVPCDVENYGEGYDYYDPALSFNITTYTQHLKNLGFRSTDNQYASATVNGVKEMYAALVNDDDVLVALGQGDNYVRVLVWSKEAYNDRKNGTTAEADGDTAEGIITDTATIQKVQEALNAKGYDCGMPDGDKGPKTTSVIQQYQTDNGLEATGEIDDTLLSSLGIH